MEQIIQIVLIIFTLYIGFQTIDAILIYRKNRPSLKIITEKIIDREEQLRIKKGLQPVITTGLNFEKEKK